MPKILIVDIGSTSGGVEKVIDSIYDRLDLNKCIIDFLIYGDKCFNERKYSRNGHVYKVAKRYDHPLRHIIEIRSFFRIYNDYDVVWIQTRSSSNVNAHKYARKYTNAKIITHSHAIKPETKSGIHRLLTSFLMKKNDRVLANCTDYAIACSRDAYQYMFGKFYKGEGKVIINGIDLDNFKFSYQKRNKIRMAYGIPKNAIVIGHVGRMVPVKNQKFIIDVFKNLTVKVSPAYLIFVGDGSERNSIEEYVKQVGLEEKTVFTGEVSDSSDYLSAFDVFVLPSLFEGLSVSAIEAQCSGALTFLSDNVPKDAMAIRTCYRLPLEEGAEIWSQRILEALACVERDRSEATIDLASSPYNIENTVKEIKSIIGVK